MAGGPPSQQRAAVQRVAGDVRVQRRGVPGQGTPRTRPRTASSVMYWVRLTSASGTSASINLDIRLDTVSQALSSK